MRQAIVGAQNQISRFSVNFLAASPPLISIKRDFSTYRHAMHERSSRGENVGYTEVAIKINLPTTVENAQF